jgi:hypothetical protein
MRIELGLPGLGRSRLRWQRIAQEGRDLPVLGLTGHSCGGRNDNRY